MNETEPAKEPEKQTDMDQQSSVKEAPPEPTAEAETTSAGAEESKQTSDAQSQSEDLTTNEQQAAEDSEAPSSGDESKKHEQQLSELRDIPVKVTAILGSARMQVSELSKLQAGAVVELDRKIGDQLDIYVNNRLVAHGEVVINEGELGISLTEIVKPKD